MKVGIKVGANAQDIKNLELTNAPYCEVWFDINKASTYDELFAFIKKRDIDVGLHFWGCLPDGTWTNFAYPDDTLIKASLDLMRKTIDIAAQNHFQYVNIHPGTRTKTKIDFVNECFTLLADPVELSVSEQLFLEHAKALHAYAIERGVLLTIETVPQAESRGWYNPQARKNPMSIFQLPVDVLIAAARQGLWIANDFGHTAANVISSDRTAVFTLLSDATQTLASQTRLIHAGFVVPPYNGTDFHNTFDNPVFDTDQAVPNKKELKELLKLFRSRDDVWVIAEPSKDHPKNYHILKEIVEAQ